MIQEDFKKIIRSIQETKQPVTMTKRYLVEGLGCQKRTEGNCLYIDHFLAENMIKADGDYKVGYIDEPITLSFKYTIKSDNFQLYFVHIKSRYKNLADFYIDFYDTTNYCCLIGLNGSGKSNVLEAISAIFYSLYHIATLANGIKKYPCEFSYTIGYILRGDYYEITDGEMYDHRKITLEMLPRNIITSYSGEDKRLWEKYYRPIYEKHCSKLTATQGFAPPFMLYLDKQEWGIALLTLLYSEDIDVVAFIESILQGRNCKIRFSYNNTNLRQWEGTDVEAFIDKLKENSEYDLQSFRETINEINFIDRASTLFYYLYKCTASGVSRVISNIYIEFGGITLEALSEGEKKMIIVNTIIHILSTNDSICLFDEPDSHIHICRKQELLSLMDSQNRSSILTTHSPSMVNHVPVENVRHIANGKLINSKRLQHIRDLSGGEINYIDGAFILSSKRILVTEGKYDIKYLKRAIDIFSKQDSKYKNLEKIAFIHAGSAGNCRALFDDVLQESLPYIEKVIFLFDYDKGGLEGWKSIKQIADTEIKVTPIFYQSDYNIILDTACKDIAAKDTYMVEDIFDPAVYSTIIATYHGMNSHKDFRCNNRRAVDAIKQHIENNYSVFNETYFANFQPVLDKLLELYNF